MSLEAAAEHVGPGGSPNGYVKLTSNELSFGPLPEAEDGRYGGVEPEGWPRGDDLPGTLD